MPRRRRRSTAAAAAAATGLPAAVAAAAVGAALAGCGGRTSPPDVPDDGFDRSALLAHLASNVLLPIQEAFAERAAALPPAIEAYCSALDAGPPGPTLEAARVAWRDAIDAWQAADALLVGPAAMDHATLRERIYAWPLLSTCGLDRDTASFWASPAGYDVSTKLPNVRSLAAVEYLLHTTAAAHTCATTPPGWEALGADLPRARCRLALRLAADVAAQGTALRDAWRPAGGDYAGELARAGQSGSQFRSAHDGVNHVSDALFYVDSMVKDMKLGEPAGLTVNACGTIETPCLRELELGSSDRGTSAIRTNLTALRRAFTGTAPGTDGPGFDDFLRTLGQGEIADRMTAALDDAVARATALPDSLRGALTTDRDGDGDVDTADYPEIVALHGAVKQFTDDLKSQFLTVLALEIPDDVATDND